MINPKMVVPVCEPSLGQKEADNVRDAVASGWVSGYKGKYLDEFEQRFAEYCGYEYGVTTSSCATALLLTLESLGIGKGDEVITTAFTMIATVSAIIHAGATPVLVDIEPDTWNMNPDLIEARITERTKAIMPVPIYGHPVDIVAIRHIADEHGLYIIEDAAEAIGSRYQAGAVDNRPDAACYSFYINKMITTGEGGMIVTNSKELADMARRLKGYDTDPESRFSHQRLGFNYRMTNMQAAMGCAQMDRIDELVAKKRQIAQYYLDGLRFVNWLQMPVEKQWAVNSYWVFGILVKPGFHVDRDNLVVRLANAGIETRNFFVPMNWQPALHRLGLLRGEAYPVAEDASQRGLYLPNGTTLTVEQVEYVCQQIWRAAK
ncbi:MAG: DegT/DnrJ/EryC1/StrS family aminotransferase [Candidatus Bathyanammoxibius sp.]